MGHAAQSLHPRQVHPPQTDRTAGQVIIIGQSGKRNLDDHTDDGWDFDLAILMLAAMVCMFGLGILYLAEREHAPEQSRMIVIGPSDFE
jgi:hypothetical protein